MGFDCINSWSLPFFHFDSKFRQRALIYTASLSDNSVFKIGEQHLK